MEPVVFTPEEEAAIAAYRPDLTEHKCLDSDCAVFGTEDDMCMCVKCRRFSCYFHTCDCFDDDPEYQEFVKQMDASHAA